MLDRKFLLVFYVALLSFNYKRLENFLKYGINIIDFHLVSNFFRLLYNFDFKKYTLNYFKEVK